MKDVGQQAGFLSNRPTSAIIPAYKAPIRLELGVLAGLFSMNPGSGRSQRGQIAFEPLRPKVLRHCSPSSGSGAICMGATCSCMQSF